MTRQYTRKHTALPWKAYDRGIGWEVHTSEDRPVNDGFHETFAMDDAAFIADACNAHEALVNAVGGMLWLGNNIDNIKHDPDGFRRYFEAALEDARTAFTKAGIE
jgi:hypothetical protein